MNRKKFRSLELIARKLLNSFGGGSHISFLKDSIIDIDTARQYQPGDKKLDSRSSLRTNQAMSRVFTPEKTMTLFIVLDISASQASKLEQAIVSCLYMSYLVDLVNDRIALLTFSDKIHQYIQPSNDNRNIIQVLEKLYREISLGEHTNLDKVLMYLGGMELNNTLVVIVSDFCYTITDKSVLLAKRALSGRNNTLAALVLINKDEWQLDNQPFIVNFVDAEDSKSNITWNFSSSNKECGFNKWLLELKARLQQAKAEPIIMPVNCNDYLLPLVKFFVR